MLTLCCPCLCWTEPCSHAVIRLKMFQSISNLTMFHSIIKLCVELSPVPTQWLNSLCSTQWLTSFCSILWLNSLCSIQQLKLTMFHSVTKILWYQIYDLFLHLLLYHQPHSSWFHLFNLINWIDSIVVHVPPSSYSSSSATSVVSSPTHVLVQIPHCITHLSITVCTPHNIPS